MRIALVPMAVIAVLLGWAASVSAQGDGFRTEVFVGAGGFVVDEKLFSLDLGATAWLTERWGLGAWSSSEGRLGGTRGLELSSASCRPNTRPGATDCPNRWPTPGPPSSSRACATSTSTSSTSSCRGGSAETETAPTRRRFGRDGGRRTSQRRTHRRDGREANAKTPGS